ncbi:glycosyltransferase family 4 protein [Priestia sp. YIM B13446]|uniref:glycosyltransferase family 4 protein n=1 Tax=unclassified Priestia TaxID=2800374 RepID=UPI00366B429C
MKVLFTTNIPSPYRVDFFNELGRYCDLTVLFESKIDKSRDRNWIADKFSNFKAIFMKGIKIGEADAFCPEIIKFLSLKKFDVIVIGAYHTPSGMLAIQYMKIKNIPFILNTDGGIKKEDSGIKHKVKENFISAASGWLSTGRVTSDYLENYGAKKDKIYVYPFTSIKKVDILEKPLSLDGKIKIREKLNIREDKMILSVGQFVHRKGFDVLLKAGNKIDRNVGIYIVGGKPTAEYIKMQKDMNLTNVHFIDFMQKDELSNYFKAADLFVLPTREDIWGLVINEAMAYGLPVITTKKCVAGIEMVEDYTGNLVEVDDANSLAEEIEKVLNDKKVTNPEKCIEIAKQYSIENMAKRHYSIFTKFLNS